MTDYQVAIPSYRRADRLAASTLPLLLDRGVPAEQVTVFVHDHDPAVSDYRAVADRFGVALRVTAARGIAAQRAAILAYYPEGTDLLSADDDVTDVRRAVTRKALAPVDDLGCFIADMFATTRQRGLSVWGLSPVPNPYFMTPDRITEGLRFLIFTFWGCVVRHGHPVHESTVPTKDDYELSLRAWWYDGAVVRHDGAVAMADIYKAPGGCQETRTVEHAVQSVASLMDQWPGLVRRNARRKSDFPEIVLATRKRHDGNPPHVPPPGVRLGTTPDRG